MDSGRPVWISDGLIPQAEAYAHKYAYNKMSLGVVKQIITTLNDKARKLTGNHYLVLCNQKAWNDVGDVLEAHLMQYHTDGAFFYSEKAGDYISVGAKGFNSFNYQGNSITFHPDKALTLECGNDKGFMMALDMTADETMNSAPVKMFTLKGGDFISNKFIGVGGEDGLSSGVVSSPVAGSKLIAWGYSGIALMNPYRSYIAREI